MTEAGSETVSTTQPAVPASPPGQVPSARRDFGLLWAGQSISLLGDQFMVLALPLLAVGVLGVSAGMAALLPFALFVPFLLLGLPAGAVVDRLRRRSTMVGCDAVQAAVFAAVAALAWLDVLTFGLLMVLVFVAGCATVFFQVAYTSYLPALFFDQRDLHRGNSRLYLSESLARVGGPVLAGWAIALVGVTWAVAGNSATFVVSIIALLAIRHREPAPAASPRERGWLLRDIRDGLRFVYRHPQIEPVITCGAVYVAFLSMVEASLVLYCKDVIGLGAAGIGLVIGAAAAGYPVGNLLSGRLIERLGIPRTLVFGAVVSVTGLVLMPVAGSAGWVVGLVAGSVVHCVGEGIFGPTALTLRQTAAPAAILGRVNSVQRFLIWGMIPVGSVLASVTITVAGLSAAVWVGGIGTALCLPVLVRRGIRSALLAQRGGSRKP